MSLEEANNLQKDCSEYLKKVQKGNKNEEQKKLEQTLTFFLMQEMMLSNL